MKYKITLFVTGYTYVDDQYTPISIEKRGEVKDWDDLQNFIGYYSEIFGSCKFEISPVKEEE